MGCVVSCCYSFLYFTQQFYESYIRNNKPVQIFIGVVGGMLLMVILLAIFGAFRHPACATPTPDTYYYQLFTKSWAQTTCKLHETHTELNEQCKATPPAEIGIDGLWPQLRGKNTRLEHCVKDENFDETKLADIRTELDSQWPSALQHGEKVFWEHQWNRYGKCSDLGLHDYFDKTLKLNKNYPINKWLTDGDIKPTDAKTYTEDEIKAVLNKKINEKQYVLTCVQVHVLGTDSKVQNQTWLQDIKLCVKYSNTWSLVDCDNPVTGQESHYHQCSGRIYYVADYKKYPTTAAPTVAPTTPTVPPTTAPPTPAPTSAPTTAAHGG